MSNEWGAFGNQSGSNWTERVTVVYGAYKWLNEKPIHHCLTSLSIRNLWDDVKLMNEIPGVEKWGFEALFQRVVRSDWVANIKNQYLSNPDRLKFFPPVTIALLPCIADIPQRQYEEQKNFSFEKDESDGGYIAQLPGLRLHFPTCKEPNFPKFGFPAMLSWDKTKYAAIAIDGQHRISALRQFVPREGQKADTSDVPATILVFDPALQVGRDLIQATREIFIDINKNAKTVDDSRLILLDDRNFYNRLTRGLILEAFPDGENSSSLEFSKIEDEISLSVTSGIPQELVDTAAGRESADINKLKSWQFTSAYILNRAIQYFAFEDRFNRFEELLETQPFSEDSEIEMENSVAQRRKEYEDGVEDDAIISDHDMLSFKPAVTEHLVKRALKMHRGFFLGLYTGFQPYREHIERFAKVAGGEDGGVIRSLLLAESSLPTLPGTGFVTKIAKDLQSDSARYRKIEKTIKSLSKPTKWEENLVWYSVFQRGLLYQPTLLRRAMEIGRSKVYGSREQFASSLVTALNELYKGGFFERDFSIGNRRIWNGIALKIGSSGEPAIDGSDGAAKRTGMLLRLMILSIMVRDAEGLRTIKANVAKQGIAGAIGSVQNGWIRYLKAKDQAADGEAKDPDKYQASAEKLLNDLFKNIFGSKEVDEETI